MRRKGRMRNCTPVVLCVSVSGEQDFKARESDFVDKSAELWKFDTLEKPAAKEFFCTLDSTRKVCGPSTAGRPTTSLTVTLVRRPRCCVHHPQGEQGADSAAWQADRGRQTTGAECGAGGVCATARRLFFVSVSGKQDFKARESDFVGKSAELWKFDTLEKPAAKSVFCTLDSTRKVCGPSTAGRPTTSLTATLVRRPQCCVHHPQGERGADSAAWQADRGTAGAECGAGGVCATVRRSFLVSLFTRKVCGPSTAGRPTTSLTATIVRPPQCCVHHPQGERGADSAAWQADRGTAGAKCGAGDVCATAARR